MPDHEIRVVPSVLDRLIDLEPSASRDVLPTRAETVRQFRRSVQRDLDHLLNSRNTFTDLAADLAEARQSILTYGLPDLSTLAAPGEQGKNRLRQALEATIRAFEPRLTNVVASVLDSPADLIDARDGRKANIAPVRLRVDARLVIDPVPEPVGFDIVVPLQTARCEVKERE